MKLIGIILWAILIYISIPIIYLKYLEIKMLFAGYKMNKIAKKHAIIKKRIIDYKFVDSFVSNNISNIFINPQNSREFKNAMMDYTEYSYVCHHFCIMDNTGNEPVICVFRNFIQYRKYFKLYMNKLHADIRRDLRV